MEVKRRGIPEISGNFLSALAASATTHLIDQSLLLRQSLLQPRSQILRAPPVLFYLLAQRGQFLARLRQLSCKLETIVA